ncbi:hypothetical protein [Streptomyces celluloflavus]|uniref:hypothetical protein n=1 Tax=Streptomyces celluloflavus TaxID=58344 RepID=UPI00366A0D20
MTSRIMSAIAFSLLAIGATTGALGLLVWNDEVMVLGILLLAAAAPPFIIEQTRRANCVTAAQLAAAHNAGYHLALDHVARGLLDQHTAPCPHPGGRASFEQAAGNVIHIRPLGSKRQEWKAL